MCSFTLGTIQSAGKLSYETAQFVIDKAPGVVELVQERLGINATRAAALSDAVSQLNELAVVIREARMSGGGHQACMLTVCT